MATEVTVNRFFLKHTFVGSAILGASIFLLAAIFTSFVSISALLAPFTGTPGYFTAHECKLRDEGIRRENLLWVCNGQFVDDQGQQSSAVYYVAEGTKGTWYGKTIPESERVDPFQAEVFPVEATKVFPWSFVVQDSVGYLTLWSYFFLFASFGFTGLLYWFLKASRPDLEKSLSDAIARQKAKETAKNHR